MGLAEFGGGGSVKWKVEHGNGMLLLGAKDPQPVNGGEFTIVVDGQPLGTYLINDKVKIQIYWPPDQPPQATRKA